MKTQQLCLSLFSLVMFASAERLVLVGGALADDNEIVYKKFIELSTDSKGQQYIGVVTGASTADTAEENGLFYADLIKKWGATKTEWIPIHLGQPNIASDPSWISKVNQMTGIFFGGGDQSRLNQLFFQGSGKNRKDSPLLTAIRKNVVANKTAIAGTSAGTTIQQATPMVTGGQSYHGLKSKTQKTVDPKDDLVSYDQDGGFGFLQFPMYIDTHFGCRGRQGRLVSLIFDLSQQTGIYLGAGIDENTALVVEGSHTTVLGQGGVNLFDLRSAKGSRKNGQLDISNVRLTYLTNGDEFDLQKFDIYRYDCGKTHIKGHERHTSAKGATTDLFNSPDRKQSSPDAIRYVGEFTLVAQDLFDSSSSPSTKGYSYETNPEFRVDLIKDSKSAGYYDVDNRDLISFEKLILDIYPLSNTVVREQREESYLGFFLETLATLVY